jgi:hypothetical protein
MLEPSLTKYLQEHPDTFSRVIERLLSEKDAGHVVASFAVLPKRKRDYDEVGDPFVKKKIRTVGEVFSVADMRSEIEDHIIARISSDPERFIDLFLLALVSRNIRTEVQAKLQRLEIEIDVVPQYCRAAFLYYEDKETHELFYDKIDRYAPATAAAWQLLSDSDELTKKFGILYTMMKREKPAYFDLALLNNAEDPLASLICLHFSAGVDSPFSRGDIKWLLERAFDWDLALFLQPQKAKEGLEWIKSLITDKKNLTLPLGDDNRPIQWQLSNPARHLLYCAHYLRLIGGTSSDLMTMLDQTGPQDRAFRENGEEVWRACFQLDDDALWDLMARLKSERDHHPTANIAYYFFKFTFEKKRLQTTEMMHFIATTLDEREDVLRFPFIVNVLRRLLLEMDCPLQAFDDLHRILNELDWFDDVVGWHMSSTYHPGLVFAEMVHRGRLDLLKVVIPIVLVDQGIIARALMEALVSREFVEKRSRDGIFQLEVFDEIEPLWISLGWADDIMTILNNDTENSHEQYAAFVGDPLAHRLAERVRNNADGQRRLSFANSAFGVLTAANSREVQRRLFDDMTMESMKTALWIALATPIPATYALDIIQRVRHTLRQQEREFVEEFFLDDFYPFQEMRFMTSLGMFKRLKLYFVYDVLDSLMHTIRFPSWEIVQSPLVLIARLAKAINKQDLVQDEEWIIDRTLLLRNWPHTYWWDFPFFAANCAMRNRRIAYISENVGAADLEWEGQPPQAWIAVQNLWIDTKPERMDVDD